MERDKLEDGYTEMLDNSMGWTTDISCELPLWSELVDPEVVAPPPAPAMSQQRSSTSFTAVSASQSVPDAGFPLTQVSRQDSSSHRRVAPAAALAATPSPSIARGKTRDVSPPTLSQFAEQEWEEDIDMEDVQESSGLSPAQRVERRVGNVEVNMVNDRLAIFCLWVSDLSCFSRSLRQQHIITSTRSR